jgi:hypothetical protein
MEMQEILNTKILESSVSCIVVCWKLRLAACFILVSFLAHSSTLKMETTHFSEMYFDFQLTTRRYIPEDRNLYNHRC